MGITHKYFNDVECMRRGYYEQQSWKTIREKAAKLGD